MIIPDKFFDSKSKVVIALLLPAIILYYRSINYDFTTLDEQWLIVHNNDLLYGWKSLKDAFIKSIAGVYYRPLLLTSVFIDYQIGKVSPFVYHFSNLLMHLISVLLLYKFLLLHKIPKQTAFIFCIIFSVHPILLHAVAWIPGRNDVLLSIFSLASMIFLLRYFQNNKRRFFFIHLFFFVCALLTKETALVLPVIFTAYYFLFKNNNRKHIAILFVGWLITSLVWLYVRDRIVEVPAPAKLSFLEMIKNFVPAMILYTGKAIIPIQQSILPLIKNASVVPGLVVILLLILLCFRPGIRDKKVASLGLVIFFLTLALPVWYSAARGSVEHYEHRIYSAMPGMLLFLSQLRFSYNSNIFQMIALVVFVSFCFKTNTRMHVYKDKENFVSAGIKECQGNYLFLFQKSEILFNQRDYATSLEYCNQAIDLRPDKPVLYSNRGTLYYTLGFYGRAASDFSKAISLSPNLDSKFYLSRCVSYEKLKKIDKAMEDLVFLKKCCPGTVPPLIDKAVSDKWLATLINTGQRLSSDTTNAKLYFERAQLYFSVEQEKQGLADLSKACKFDPSNKEYLQLYMTHYEKQPK